MKTAHEVREYLHEIAGVMDRNGYTDSVDDERFAGIRGAVRGAMGEVFDFDRDRRLVLSWLFFDRIDPKQSTNDLTRGQILSLHRLINPYKLFDKWTVSKEFGVYMRWCLREAEIVYNRQEKQTQLDIFSIEQENVKDCAIPKKFLGQEDPADAQPEPLSMVEEAIALGAVETYSQKEVIQRNAKIFTFD